MASGGTAFVFKPLCDVGVSKSDGMGDSRVIETKSTALIPPAPNLTPYFVSREEELKYVTYALANYESLAII